MFYFACCALNYLCFLLFYHIAPCVSFVQDFLFCYRGPTLSPWPHYVSLANPGRCRKHLLGCILAETGHTYLSTPPSSTTADRALASMPRFTPRCESPSSGIFTHPCSSAPHPWIRVRHILCHLQYRQFIYGYREYAFLKLQTLADALWISTRKDCLPCTSDLSVSSDREKGKAAIVRRKHFCYISISHSST
ncbi:hypothetical protein DFH11DRAFT_1608342 [Phellopilus nigrolimitatus]|nr:hypothetical protein DFH11DRAFT_1608342 [Phellopilus nigrolimitatus]